jgi:hypothetical protein
MGSLAELNPGDVMRGIRVDYIEGSGSKERPVVVVALMIEQSLVVLFPVYSRKNKNYRPLAVEVSDWEQAGLDHASYVDVARLMTIDAAIVEDEGIARVGSLSDNDWENLVNAYSKYRAE